MEGCSPGLGQCLQLQPEHPQKPYLVRSEKDRNTCERPFSFFFLEHAYQNSLLSVLKNYRTASLQYLWRYYGLLQQVVLSMIKRSPRFLPSHHQPHVDLRTFVQQGSLSVVTHFEYIPRCIHSPGTAMSPI